MAESALPRQPPEPDGELATPCHAFMVVWFGGCVLLGWFGSRPAKVPTC